MPNFDSFDPDGGQSSFFAAPPAQPIPSITDQPAPQQLGGGGSPYPDIPGAAQAPNQTASGYYPDEPQPASSGVRFPQDRLQESQGDFGGVTRDVGAPRVVAGMPGYDPETDPQIPPSARAAPEMSGSVTIGPGGRPIYDPGGGPRNPRIQALMQQLGQGKAIDLGRPGGQGPTARAGHERAGKEFAAREQELGPLRRDVQEALAQPLPRPPPAQRLPSYDEWRQQHNHGLLQGSGPIFAMAAGALMILSGAFGRSGRGVSLPAMQGMGAFVNGLGQGNRAMASKGLADYRTGVQELQRNYENSRQEYEDILKNQNISIDRKMEALKVAASKYNDMQTYRAAEEKRADRLDRLNLQREKQITQLQTTLQKMERQNEEFEWKRGQGEAKNQQKEAQQSRIEYDNAQRRAGAADESLRKALQGSPQNAEAVARLRQASDEAHARVAASKARFDASIAKLSGQETPPTQQTAPQAAAGGDDRAQSLSNAKAAIAAGKDPAAVRKKLQDAGIDPSALDESAPSEDSTMPDSTAPAETYSSGGGF